MKNTWFWLIAVAAILALSGTTQAGSPAMTMLLLPQLFGQEPSRNAPLPTTGPRPTANPVLAQPDLNPRDRLSPEPEYIPIPSSDDDSLGDMFWDAVSMLLERTCSAWVVQKLLPLPPLNLAADAVLGYFSVMDAREAAAESARLTQSLTPPPPPATGPGPVCEMLPFPKLVSGPVPCVPKSGCGSFAVGAPMAVVPAYDSKKFYIITDGASQGEQVHSFPVTGNDTVLDAMAKVNGLPTAALKSRVWVARASGPGCAETILPVDWIGIQRGATASNWQIKPGDRIYVLCGNTADACVGSACCDAPVKAAAKACKCCEECTDCKECTCGKKTNAIKARIMMEPARACPLPMVQAEFQLFAPPVPWMSEGPLGQAIGVPAMPGCPPQFSCNPPTMHPPVPDMPLYPIDELKQLIHQRQMITRAIEQIEQELMRMTLEKQKAQTQAVFVTHSTQKVHLASELFDAHCNALRCVDGEPHRLILEGDVRLVCKKSGHPVCIEAPCVTVNMKDGTFSVLSLTTAAPCPLPASSVQRTEGPRIEIPPSNTVPAASYMPQYRVPMPMAAPVPTMPQGWQQVPYRVVPPSMPMPISDPNSWGWGRPPLNF